MEVESIMEEQFEGHIEEKCIGQFKVETSFPKTL